MGHRFSKATTSKDSKDIGSNSKYTSNRHSLPVKRLTSISNAQRTQSATARHSLPIPTLIGEQINLEIEEHNNQQQQRTPTIACPIISTVPAAASLTNSSSLLNNSNSLSHNTSDTNNQSLSSVTNSNSLSSSIGARQIIIKIQLAKMENNGNESGATAATTSSSSSSTATATAASFINAVPQIMMEANAATALQAPFNSNCISMIPISADAAVAAASASTESIRATAGSSICSNQLESATSAVAMSMLSPLNNNPLNIATHHQQQQQHQHQHIVDSLNQIHLNNSSNNNSSNNNNSSSSSSNFNGGNSSLLHSNLQLIVASGAEANDDDNQMKFIADNSTDNFDEDEYCEVLQSNNNQEQQPLQQPSLHRTQNAVAAPTTSCTNSINSSSSSSSNRCCSRKTRKAAANGADGGNAGSASMADGPLSPTAGSSKKRCCKCTCIDAMKRIMETKNSKTNKNKIANNNNNNNNNNNTNNVNISSNNNESKKQQMQQLQSQPQQQQKQQQQQQKQHSSEQQQLQMQTTPSPPRLLSPPVLAQQQEQQIPQMMQQQLPANWPHHHMAATATATAGPAAAVATPSPSPSPYPLIPAEAIAATLAQHMPIVPAATPTATVATVATNNGNAQVSIWTPNWTNNSQQFVVLSCMPSSVLTVSQANQNSICVVTTADHPNSNTNNTSNTNHTNIANSSTTSSNVNSTTATTPAAAGVGAGAGGPTVHSQVDYMHCLVPDLDKITNSSFYWGKMDRYEAERLLEGKPEGTFLLRDSAQEEFLFSVTFRKYGRSLHARIEQSGHKFSFDCHDPCVYTAATVTGLLEHYKDPRCVMFFEPMLTIPLHRPKTFSLQELCRAKIVSNTSYDGINELELPLRLKSYLKEYHYKQMLRIKPVDDQLYACT